MRRRTNTKHNSEAEASAEVRLRRIIDTIPTIIWRKFPDGSADFLNQRFREYTGLSLQQGLGWGWINALHPDDCSLESKLYKITFVAVIGSRCSMRLMLVAHSVEHKTDSARNSGFVEDSKQVVLDCVFT